MDKKSFILYLDRKKEIDLLTNEQCGILFKSIFEYVETGIAPEISDLAVRILLSFLITQIDGNAAKWEEAKKKRSEAGKRGGAPKGNQNASKQAKQAMLVSNKQKQAKQAVTVTVTDTVTGILPVTEVTGNIEQDCTAPARAAQPAQEEESVIPWDELDPDEWA